MKSDRIGYLIGDLYYRTGVELKDREIIVYLPEEEYKEFIHDVNFSIACFNFNAPPIRDVYELETPYGKAIIHKGGDEIKIYKKEPLIFIPNI